ncbi:MAG: ferritin family protein [Thermovenabulum sp.]|uniref:ferritin family protein n=1 Tax=Thermovenabulum sp. TaxID=3100335 RepID=UPI003C7D169B
MKEAYKKAIEFERKGFEFYKKIAGEITQPLAKRLFESLAEQEKEHIRSIEDIFEKGSFEEGHKELSDGKKMEDEIKKVFYELEEEKRKIPLDHVEGYKLAMELEKKGYEMYKEFFQNAEGKEKEFFERLMEQEKEHLESLDNVYRYLTESEVWYSEEESKVWNWMNM